MPEDDKIEDLDELVADVLDEEETHAAILAGADSDSGEEDDGIGFRVFCDVSQATISFGDWYHKRGEDFDLCEAEWLKLTDAEQAKFVKVESPDDLGEDLGEYVGDEDDMDDMSPEEIMGMIAEAFMEKEGRPPTEEEAAAFMQMIAEAQDEEGDSDDDDDDGWATDDGEEDSDDDSDDDGGGSFGPMFVPDDGWSVGDLKAFIEDSGGSHAGIMEKSELIELAKSLAKPAAKPSFGGAPGAFSFALPGGGTPAPAPAGAFSFNLGGAPAAAPAAPGGGAFAFNFKAPGAPAAAAAGAGKFNFNVGQSAEALAASKSTSATAGAAAAGAAAPAPAPVAMTPRGDTAASGTAALPAAKTQTVSEYERQVDALTNYYAKHDPEKDGAACKAIIDKRRKTAPHLHEVAWKDLCSKLAAKYKGEDPDSLAAAAAAAPAMTPRGGDAAGAAQAAQAARLAKIESSGASSTPAKQMSEGEQSLQNQVDVLAKFYAKYDAGKTADECRTILKKRLGEGQESMPAADWVKLCGKLGKKYGEDPLSM